MKNIRPYMFLTVLITVLVFILGVRYGQRVEKTNKKIDYLQSLAVSPSPIPTSPPLEFKQYTNQLCGIRILYPSTLKVKESSASAIFTLSKDNKEQVEVDCAKPNDTFFVLMAEDIATEEAVFKGKKIITKVSGSTDEESHYVFNFKNPINGKTIYVSVLKKLYPLFEKSLEFQK